ncbi:MAG TPA: ABC transporter permease [Pyrinomonadaceae bacterium]|nr:ABC transporter permease [Pyrinomonadaceae bacterium]
MSTTTDDSAQNLPSWRAPIPESIDLPWSTIERTNSWKIFDLRELWAYRELLVFLAWRDVRVRYKQAVLGMGWVVLQPLLMTLVFTVFLGVIVRVPSDNVPYPLFAYSGLLLWTFFSGAISGSGNSLIGNAHLITKVYFPRLLIPLASILARMVDLFVALVMLVGLMIYFRAGISGGLLMAPLLIGLLALLALGLGMWTSALNVKYRDVGLALPVFVQLWMFVSPVVYPLTLVPEPWRFVYSLNPLVGIIEGFRAALFGKSFNWQALAISAIVTLALLVYAGFVFKRREKTFADII